MSGDEFAAFLRQKVPSVDISDARLDALIDSTLLQAQSLAQSKGRWRWLASPRWWPVMRYAVPMVVAVVMGITVSSNYGEDLPVAEFSSVMLSSSLVPTGS